MATSGVGANVDKRTCRGNGPCSLTYLSSPFFLSSFFLCVCVCVCVCVLFLSLSLSFTILLRLFSLLSLLSALCFRSAAATDEKMARPVFFSFGEKSSTERERERERERENKNADDPIIRRRTKKEIHTESMPAVSETGPAANEKVADSVWDQENRRDFVPTTLETRYQLGGQLERHRRFRRPDFLEEKKLSKTR